VQTCDHRGLVVGAAVVIRRNPTPAKDLRPGRLAGEVDVAGDPVPMFLADEGPHGGVFGERVAEANLLDPLEDPSDDLIGDGTFDNQAGAGETDLALVTKGGFGCQVRCFADVG